MKRVVAFILTVFMLFNTVGLQISYAEEAPGVNTIIRAERVEISGDTVDIAVSISGNPGLSAWAVNVKYDTSVFYPEDGSEDSAEELADDSKNGPEDDSENGSQDGPANGEIAPLCTVGSAFDGKGTFTYQANAQGCNVIWLHTSEVKADGTLFTLHLKVADGAKAGTYPVRVEAVEKNIINDAEELVPVSTRDGAIEIREFDSKFYIQDVSVDCDATAVTVPVCVQDNPGIAGAVLNIVYDREHFAPVMDGDDPKCVKGDVLGSSQLMSAITEDGWRILLSNASDVQGDGVLCYLSFDVLGNNPSGKYIFGISHEAENVLDENEKLVAFTNADGKVTITHKNIVKTDGVEPTCTEAGRVDYWSCQACGNLYSDEACTVKVSQEDAVLAAKGHTVVIRDAVPATCTTAGLTQGSYCSACEQILNEQEVQPALGHDYIEGICSRCYLYDGETKLSGEISDTIQWKFTPDGKLSVLGTGVIPDFASAENVPWHYVAELVTQLILSGDITGIGANVFGNLPNLSKMDFMSEESVWKKVTIADGNDCIKGLTPSFYCAITDIALSAETDVDLSVDNIRQISVVTTPANAIRDLSYTSDNESIATVDEHGLVTFLRSGEVTITVTSKDELHTSEDITFTAYYYTKAEVLTAELSTGIVYITIGESPELIVKGDSVIDSSKLHYVSSDVKTLSVDETGKLTALKKGNAIITASLKDDPLNRSVTLNVKIQDVQEDAYITLNTVKAPDEGLILDMNSDKRIYGLGMGGTSQAYTFTSSDKSVAAVSGTTLTIPAKAYGQCTITATSKDKKTEILLPVVIKNYAPRLENTKITLNNNLIAGVRIPYHTSYHKKIESVELYEVVSKKVAETPTDKVKVTIDEDALILSDASDVFKSGKTISCQLKITFEGGSTDDSLSLSIKRSDAYPALKTKVAEPLNNFYTDASTKVLFTPTGATVSNIVLLDGADYKGTFEAGNLKVENLTNPVNKKSLAGTARVYFEGYRGYKDVKVTVSATNKAPALKLKTTSAVIYAGAVTKTLTTYVVDNKNNPVDLTAGAVTTTNESVIISQDNNCVSFDKNWNAKTEIPLEIQNANWAKPVKLKYTVNMATGSSSLPKFTVKTSTLKLNKKYPAFGAETTTSLNHANVQVMDTELLPSGSKITDAVTVELKDGVISASIVDGKIPEKGTYSYTFLPRLDDGRTLKQTTVKVVVEEKNMATSLKASGKLDVLIRDTSMRTYTVKTSNVNAELSGVELTGTDADKFVAVVGDTANTIQLKLKAGESYAVKNYKVAFKMHFKDIADELTSTVQTVKVQQGTIKVKAEPALRTVYQSGAESYVQHFEYSISSPDGAAISSVRLGKLDANFQKCMTNAESTVKWTIASDGKTAAVDMDLNDISKFVAGKTYELPVILTPEGAVTAKADVTVKVKIKIVK